MKSIQFDLSRITQAFDAAALDSSKWHSAMEVAAEATNSFGAALFPVRGPIPEVPFSQSIAGAVEVYVRDGWIEKDERYRSHPALARNGVSTEFDFTTPDEIATHPYYQEFLAPFGLRWFAAVKIASGNDFWALSIQRTIQQGPFSPAELRQLQRLGPALSGAGALARALSFARADAALQGFEVSGRAVVLVNRRGNVVRVNEAAENMLGPDLQVRSGRLLCANHDASLALERTLHEAIWSTARSLIAPVVLPRREGLPILAYVSRPAAVVGGAFAPCHAVVVLVDLEARASSVERDLIKVFKLTPCEARLANRMLSEESLRSVAQGLGIAYETARNVEKSILQKTRTHRQGQLIALLARFAYQSPQTSS